MKIKDSKGIGDYFRWEVPEISKINFAIFGDTEAIAFRDFLKSNRFGFFKRSVWLTNSKNFPIKSWYHRLVLSFLRIYYNKILNALIFKCVFFSPGIGKTEKK